MNVSEIIIATFGAFCLFIGMPIIISIASYKEKQLKLQRELAQSGGHEMRAEVESLRHRVAVLERLATSEDIRLAGDIERLRQRDARSGA